MNETFQKHLTRKYKSYLLLIKACTYILLIQTNNTYALNKDAEEPLEIFADSVMIDDAKGLSTFSGDAVITQGSLLLKANLIELYTDEKEVIKAVAKGSNSVRAYYKQNQSSQPRFVEATAITITYSLEKQFIYLTGKANLIQGFDSFSAGSLEYDIENDKVIAEKSEQKDDSEEPVRRVHFKINF